MSKITETTRVVKVTDFVQECPPEVLISEMMPGPGGRLRLFTQKIQVPDADLWACLMDEVKTGDTISVTVKTIWPDEGRYYTALGDFEARKRIWKLSLPHETHWKLQVVPLERQLRQLVTLRWHHSGR